MSWMHHPVAPPNSITPSPFQTQLSWNRLISFEKNSPLEDPKAHLNSSMGDYHDADWHVRGGKPLSETELRPLLSALLRGEPEIVKQMVRFGSMHCFGCAKSVTNHLTYSCKMCTDNLVFCGRCRLSARFRGRHRAISGDDYFRWIKENIGK